MIILKIFCGLSEVDIVEFFVRVILDNFWVIDYYDCIVKINEYFFLIVGIILLVVK